MLVVGIPMASVAEGAYLNAGYIFTHEIWRPNTNSYSSVSICPCRLKYLFRDKPLDT
jgi:hypothetical protein